VDARKGFFPTLVLLLTTVGLPRCFPCKVIFFAHSRDAASALKPIVMACNDGITLGYMCMPADVPLAFLHLACISECCISFQPGDEELQIPCVAVWQMHVILHANLHKVSLCFTSQISASLNDSFTIL
jgi:hypothetical protein